MCHLMYYSRDAQPVARGNVLYVAMQQVKKYKKHLMNDGNSSDVFARLQQYQATSNKKACQINFVFGF